MYNTTIIDATVFGNVGRFINHSCQPNLQVEVVRVGMQDALITFFAVEDIPSHQEISFHYGETINTNINTNTNTITNTITNDTTSMQRLLCHCGSNNCSGYLPYLPDQKLL